jgi:hypothetical protein
MVSFQSSTIITRWLTLTSLAGLCALSYPMGTTQFGDLGRSKGRSQQDSCIGTEVEELPRCRSRSPSLVYVRYVDSQRIVNVSSMHLSDNPMLDRCFCLPPLFVLRYSFFFSFVASNKSVCTYLCDFNRSTTHEHED